MQVGHGSLSLAALAKTTAWANPFDVVFTDDSSRAVATLAVRIDVCERVPTTATTALPDAAGQGDELGPHMLDVALRVEVRGSGSRKSNSSCSSSGGGSCSFFFVC